MYFADSPDDACLVQLHADAITLIRSGLTGLKALSTDAMISSVIGAAGSSEFLALVEAARQSAAQLISVLAMRTSLSDSDRAGIEKMYPTLKAKVDRCYSVDPTPSPDPSPTPDPTPDPSPTPTPSPAAAATLSLTEIGIAAIVFWLAVRLFR
jgi:hypothetical protein